MSHLRNRVIVGVVWVGLVASLGSVPIVKAESQTIVGEVVDPGLYLKEGRHGPDVTDQTYQAVDGGQTLGLLDTANGTLYLLLPEETGEDPNELVYDHVNKKVKVTGAVYERGGVHGLVVSTVEPLEPEETKSPETMPATKSPAPTPPQPGSTP